VTADSWFGSGERIPVELDGATFEVFCRVRGSGPSLTLLHGFPTSSWDWAKVAPALEQRFRLLCFDFLGLGDSDKPRRHRYSILEQADLTDALWRHYAIAETVLVGHDYGATVAQELLARRRTEARISSVILLNAAVYVRLARPLLIQRLLASRITGPLAAHAVRENVFRRSLASVFSPRYPISENELREHWRILQRHRGTAPVSHRLSRYMVERRLHASRWEDALESAHVPLRFVWGMADPRSGAHIAHEIRRRLPDAPLVGFDDVGHYPHLEVPELVAHEIAKQPPASRV
jgi:pimeloyl-ACP methyl ester carboxylesterase